MLQPDYARLRIGIQPRSGRIRRVLIAFGGVDKSNLLGRSLQVRSRGLQLLDLGRERLKLGFQARDQGVERIGDRIVARTYGERKIDELWRRVCELPRSALLLVSVGFKGRLPLAPCETRMVGVNELRLATRSALRAIADRVVSHNGDPELARHVLTAVVAYTGEAGPVLSQRRSPGPITYARALTWCIGATLEVADVKPAPRVYSAS